MENIKIDNLNLNFYKNDAISFSFDDEELIIEDEGEYFPALIYSDIRNGTNVIGRIIGYEIPYYDFFDFCDNQSGDLYYIANVICDENGVVKSEYLPKKFCEDNVFVLDEIYLEKDYRNRGIASLILKNLSTMLNYQFNLGKVIFLCASDFENLDISQENETYKKNTEKLINFYQKFDFKLIKDRVMYLINEE